MTSPQTRVSLPRPLPDNAQSKHLKMLERELHDADRLVCQGCEPETWTTGRLLILRHSAGLPASSSLGWVAGFVATSRSRTVLSAITPWRVANSPAG